MALIKCPKCGRSISDKAQNCPGCGWQVNLNKVKVNETGHTKSENGDINFAEPDQAKKMEEPGKKEKIVNKKMFLGIAVIMVVALWSVMLVNMTANRITKKFLKEITMADASTVIENVPTQNELEGTEGKDEQEDHFKSDSVNDLSVSEFEQNEKKEIDTENSGVSFQYTGYEIFFEKIIFYIKITNTGEKPITLSAEEYHYLNDVSIEMNLDKMNGEIPPGKSTLLELQFNISLIEAAKISTIDSLTFQYNIVGDKDSKEKTPGEVSFTELGITF